MYVAWLETLLFTYLDNKPKPMKPILHSDDVVKADHLLRLRHRLCQTVWKYIF
jgi:hypothetical protein